MDTSHKVVLILELVNGINNNDLFVCRLRIDL